MLPAREWREDCPFCKSPYPWAPRRVWAAYHQRYLDDLTSGVDPALPHLASAERAYEAQAAERQRRAKAAKRTNRREARADWGTTLFDTWPKRIGVIAGSIVAVLGLLFGPTNIPDLLDRDKRPPTTTPLP